MKSKKRIALAIPVLLLVALWIVACEDSDLTAPLDSSLVMTANPSTVVIDPNDGQTSADVSLTVTAFDVNGFTLPGILVTFSASGGTIIAVNGIALGDTGTPTAETDANGKLTATLRVGREGPETVTAIATSGVLVESIEIGKFVVDLNELPFASFTPIPASPAIAGQIVTFDGSLSIDSDGDIQCFQWTIDSDVDACDEVLQGTTLTSFDRIYPCPGAPAGTLEGENESMDLRVTLRVSDDPRIGAGCPLTEDFDEPCCNDAEPVNPARLSPNVDVQDYVVECDNVRPVANGGQDKQVPLGEQLSVLFDASGSVDPDGKILSYRWDCGSDDPPLPGPGSCDPMRIGRCVFCSYGPGEAVYTVTLSVTDDGQGGDPPLINPDTGRVFCEKTGTDEILVNVFDPAGP